MRDFRYEQVLIEENGRYGEGGFFMTLHSRLVAPYIGELGTEEQKTRILPQCASGETILGIAMTEPGAGSDLAGIKTRAEDKGDHWLLNGSKTYISNGQIGDLFIVVARTDPNRRHGLGLFLVERGMEGFKRGRNLKKMGLKAQDTSELFFNDVKVPKSNVLGEPGKGFHFLTHFLAEERLITACGAMTLCQVGVRRRRCSSSRSARRSASRSARSRCRASRWPTCARRSTRCSASSISACWSTTPAGSMQSRRPKRSC